MRLSERAFGIYVHWPFCKAKCPYCDFNSHVRHTPIDAMAYARAIAQELSWFQERTQRRQVSSIFFGGGTPSLMPASAVAHILDKIANLWTLKADAEISLEANPTSAEAQNFRGFKLAGINRLSVGVQALNDNDLKALGRQHTVAEALSAFRLARNIFPHVSFDLIYARPKQSLAQWQEELRLALAEQNGHMSLYQLTIEPETRFFDLYEMGKLSMPEEDTSVALYDITQELTQKAGLDAYEVSNHAQAGHQSQHNLLYWRYQDYIGVGPGAHGRFSHNGENDQPGQTHQKYATITEKHPESWLDSVMRYGHGLKENNAITASAQAMEYMLMGLRLHEGIDRTHYESLAGRTINAKKLAYLKALNLITEQDGQLIATPAGRKLLNAIIAELAL